MIEWITGCVFGIGATMIGFQFLRNNESPTPPPERERSAPVDSSAGVVLTMASGVKITFKGRHSICTDTGWCYIRSIHTSPRMPRPFVRTIAQYPIDDVQCVHAIDSKPPKKTE